jgi:hypothetical protein
MWIDRRDQLLLGAEVPIDGWHRHPGLTGHRRDRQAEDAAGHDPDRRVEDERSSLVRLLCPQLAAIFPWPDIDDTRHIVNI